MVKKVIKAEDPKVAAINARLNEFRIFANLSQRDMAEEIGVKQQSLQRVIKSGRPFTTWLLLTVAIRFPNLNLNWLIRGTGNMWLNMDSSLDAKTKRELITKQTMSPEELIESQADEIKRLRAVLDLFIKQNDQS